MNSNERSALADSGTKITQQNFSQYRIPGEKEFKRDKL